MRICWVVRRGPGPMTTGGLGTERAWGRLERRQQPQEHGG